MALLPQEVIDQVLDRSDIVDVVSAYVPLKKAGQNFKGLSPFNPEKTPSFVVSPQKQIFHCFSSGTGGNVISFIMRVEHLNFPEAVRFLAKRSGVEIPEISGYTSSNDNAREKIFEVNEMAVEYFHRILLSDKSEDATTAREYLKTRGVDLEAVNQFKLGFALDEWDGLIKHLQSKDIPLNLMEQAGLIIPRQNKEGFYDRFRGRVIFPILDAQGKTRAFGARTLKADESAKYLNSPETQVYTKGKYLFGFHLAKLVIGQLDQVIVSEGYMDCLIPFRAGVGNIVASLGTALTVDQIRLIRRYTKNVVMLYDADKAGQAAMVRSFDALVEEDLNVKVARLDEGEDPDSFVRQHGIEKFNERIREAQSLFDYKYEYLTKKHDVNLIENKAVIAREMFETVKRFESSVVQTGYLSKLAKNLKVPEQSVRDEYKNFLKGSKSGFSSEKKQMPIQLQKTDVAEYQLLRLLLQNDEYVSISKEALNPDEFQDVKIRTVISKVYQLFEETKTVNSSQLINLFEEDSFQQMITSIIAEEEPENTDRDKMFGDYLKRIQSRRVKQKTEEIREKIKQAELEGNQEQLLYLMKEFNQLIKK